MKSFLLTIALVGFCYGSIAAQAIQKGQILVGTTTEIIGGLQQLGASSGGFAIINSKLDLNGDKTDGTNATLFNLSPAGAYFFADGLAVGAKITFVYSKVEDNDPSTLLTAGPFARYYFDLGNAKPFIQGNLGFGRSSNGPDDNDKANFLNLGLGAGAAFFFNDYVSIDLALGYYYERSNAPGNSDFRVLNNAFGLGVGFSFFIGRSDSSDD